MTADSSETVVLTGAGGDIGQAIAERCATRKMTIVLVGRDSDRLASARATLGRLTPMVHCFAGDASDTSFATEVAAQVEAKFGGLRALVNNAGSALPARRVQETTDAELDEAMRDNFFTAFRMTRALLPLLVRDSGASVVNIASAAATVGMPFMSAYAAAKAGVVALTRSVAVEYGASGLRCNCLCPGAIETGMTSDVLGDPNNRRRAREGTLLRRIGQADDVASAVMFLLSREAAFITGAIIPVDGGLCAK